MARRKLAALTAAAVLGALVPSIIASQPAQALQDPVGFTAVNLPTYQTNGIAWTTESAQGLVFVGGTFSSVRPAGVAEGGAGEVSRTNFVVLDPATGNPTGCAPTFELPSDPGQATVRSTAVSPDGRTLYVGGYFARVNGVTANHLVAIDIASCSLITSFRPIVNGTVRAIVATDTAVYFGGAFNQVGSELRNRAAAVGAVGTSDPGGLLPWAPSLDKEMRAIAIKPDNSLVVIGGDFDTVNGANSRALVVVDPVTGANVHTYPVGFIAATSVVKDIEVDNTGFYTGNEGTGTGVFDGRIALDWSTLDQRWRDTCLGATQSVIVWKGVLYSASHAHDCSSVGEWPDGLRHHLLAQSTAGPTSKLSWFPNTDEGMGEQIGPRDMVVASKGGQDYMVVVGEFTQVNGSPQVGITRFGSTVDSPPTMPTPSVSSFRPGQVRVAWRSSLDLDNTDLTYSVYRDNGTAPIHTVTSKSYFFNRKQLTFIDNQPAGSTHTYRVTVTDGRATVATPWRSVTVASVGAPYAEKVMADGATFLWRYDETGDVLMSDATLNNNNGTLRGGATYQVTGAIGGDTSKALTVSGGGATIYSENSFEAPTQVSVETWFKTTTTSGGKILGFGDRYELNSGRYDKHIYMTNSGQLVWGVYTTATQVVKTSKAYNDGNWHHVVGTIGANGQNLYVDGVRAGRNANTQNQPYTGQWRAANDTLSGWPNQPASNSWGGTLDETAVYPSTLSATQVAEHYALGTGSATLPGPSDHYGRVVTQDDPTQYWRLNEAAGAQTAEDITGAGATGRYSGSISYQQQPGAVAGNTDPAIRTTGGVVASSASLSAPTTFTADAWFKTNTGSGGKILGFGNQQTNNSSSYDRHVYMRNDGRLVFGIRYPNTVITTSGMYNDNAWHHVAITQSPTGSALYVDGVLIGTNNSTSANSYTGFWRLGGDNVGGWPSAPSSAYFNGYIDEFAVYPRVLSDAQIAQHAAAGRTSPDLAAPTIPTNVVTGMNAGNALLSWTPSMDNVGVTAYDVHRSSEASFTPDASTKVATVASPSWSDANVGIGQWYYRVVARDQAGNASAASTQVSIIVTDNVAPSTPTGLSVTTTSSTAALTWESSTDNIGVTEYAIHRSKTSSFTPSTANQVATVTTANYLDTELAMGTYYYIVVARDGAQNVSAPSATITAAVVDNKAPTVPDGVTTAVAGTQVTVTWSPSTDDIDVTGYEVHRSTETGFQPSAATRVATVADTTYVDNPGTDGTIYYRIIARDAAGNLSPGSVETTAVIAPQPTTITVQASADTYVNAGSPASNYGANGYLVSRGTPTAIGYVRFAVPTAPGGKVLTSAILRLRTTSDPAAGSAASEPVTVANNTWDESTVTWNDRPSVGTVVAGTIPAGTVSNTTYDVPLETSALAGFVGAQGTLAVSSAAADGLYFYAKDYGAAGYRPQLLLTFSPPDTSAPTVPTNVAAGLTGSTARVTWTASTDAASGIAVYHVYRSANPGFTPDSSTLVGNVTGTSFQEILGGVGTWYYRVVAEDAAGNTSVASTAVSLVVPDTSAPTIPTGLTTEVLESSVVLAWTASSDDVGVAGYRVYRGSTEDFVANSSTLAATVTDTTWTDPTAPAGTVWYRVLAYDAAGNVGQTGPAVSAALPDVTAPSAVANLAGTATDGSIRLTFTEATDDVGVTAYLVYRSTIAGFTPGPETLVGTYPTSPIADGPLDMGTYYYRLQARDAAGNVGPLTSEIAVVVPDRTPPSAPTGLNAVAAGGRVDLTWTASTDNVAVTGYIVYRSATSGFTPDASTQIGTSTSESFTDTSAGAGTRYYVVKARDAVGNVSEASGQASTAAPDVSAPSRPTGVTASGTGSPVTVSWTASTDDVGVTEYRVHRSATAGFTPSADNQVGTTTETSFADDTVTRGVWYYVVVARDAAGNVSQASDEASATVGDVVAPSSPQAVAASQNSASGGVAVSWAVSTDNVGVTGYQVHRSATSDFAPAESTLVGSTTELTALTEASVPAGTWYYRVVALDAAGNVSAASAVVTVVVTESPTIVSVTPTADTYGNAGAPKSNYGSASNGVVRGTPGGITYLRFVVPQAPAGKTLTGAVLRVRTTTDSLSGSKDQMVLRVGGDDTWVESALTWNTRPALSGTVLGRSPQNSLPNSSYDIPLDLDGVSTLVGGQGTITLSSEGSDSWWIWYREHPNPSVRPQLILTWS